MLFNYECEPSKNVYSSACLVWRQIYTKLIKKRISEFKIELHRKICSGFVQFYDIVKNVMMV